MIKLTRFNGGRFYLNITHIETVESTPDTVITLINGKKYIVRDPADEVAAQITAFYQRAHTASVTPRLTDDSIE
ncbi:flagellar FlbD family protein [Brevibacillus sp. H7]|uniref:flagellar FlbD family protein n=1 Tax=Brevibacillus sp. H7 TaxID=3349138 RepID=UPI00381BCFCD